MKMAKSFIKNQPAINMTIVGFGQAGSRIADEFGKFKNENGSSVYNCLALNSNDGDLEGLKNILPENRVSLELGGLGKNPEVALSILEENERAKEKLKSFIRERVRPTDELVLFFAGLGGGTGTSTIVKAIDEFYEYNNKPRIAEEFEKIKKEIDPAVLKADPKKYLREAFRKAEKNFVKIGVIVTLPLRADGPDALRQVNNFAQKIWDIAKNPSKGVAFVIFADNQQFYDEFSKLPENERNGIDNFRDYGNYKIAEVLHELNTATTGGGTTVTFDSADLRRIILEHTGCLVINKLTKSAKAIKNGHDLKEMFIQATESSYLHQPIRLVDSDGTASKVYHLGMLAVLDQSNSIGSAFIDDARVEIANKLPLKGTIFTGYLEEKNDYSVSVYTFFKTEALPERLAVGLVKEYEEFMNKQRQVIFKQASISSIVNDEEDDFDIDLRDFDVDEDLISSISEEKNKKDEEDDDINLDDMDFSVLMKD